MEISNPRIFGELGKQIIEKDWPCLASLRTIALVRPNISIYFIQEPTFFILHYHFSQTPTLVYLFYNLFYLNNIYYYYFINIYLFNYLFHLNLISLSLSQFFFASGTPSTIFLSYVSNQKVWYSLNSLPLSYIKPKTHTW